MKLKTYTYSAPKGPVDYMIDTLTVDSVLNSALSKLRDKFDIKIGDDGNEWYLMTKRQANLYHALKLSKMKPCSCDTKEYKFSKLYVDKMIEKHVSRTWRRLLCEQRIEYRCDGEFYYLTHRQNTNFQMAKRGDDPTTAFPLNY